MRLTLLAFAALLAGCAASSPPDPAVLADGAFAHGFRCKGCHEPATPGAKKGGDGIRLKVDVRPSYGAHALVS